MLRKEGKLPGKTEKTSYTIEYGKAVMEIQKTALNEGEQVVICDDLVATGGTAKAAAVLIEKLKANDRIALTDKIDSCKVFSFGRDHGHFGRILNQTVISKPSIHISPNGKEITGFCFTPQDGNSLLSTISITEWFLYPHSYENKIQCLSPFFFDEV